MDCTVIANAVEVDAGVERVSMRFIKKYAAPERERLSSELCVEISKALYEHGLLTVPRMLPTTENGWVYVISKDRPLGQAVGIAATVANFTALGASPLGGLEHSFPGLQELFLGGEPLEPTGSPNSANLSVRMRCNGCAFQRTATDDRGLFTQVSDTVAEVGRAPRLLRDEEAVGR